jgi:predicted amidophosphoribosyltransferase
MWEALDALNPQWLSTATLIPMPPSKVKSDPMYDDRLIQMFQVLGAGLQLDVREMIAQRESTGAAHSTEVRPRVDELFDNYWIDDSLVNPPPRVIGVIDDVLTTWSHFKAVQRLLRDRFPAVKIYGIFVARRVPESVDIIGF